MSGESSFRQRLAHWRHRAHLSQEKLAERTGLSRNYIGLLESGRRHPSLQTVLQVQKALGVKLADLVADVPMAQEVREEPAAYGEAPSGSAVRHRRLLRRLERCTPEELDAISRIVSQVLKLRRPGKKSRGEK